MCVNKSLIQIKFRVWDEIIIIIGNPYTRLIGVLLEPIYTSHWRTIGNPYSRLIGFPQIFIGKS